MERNSKGQFVPMGNIKNIVGKKYGILEVKSFSHVKKRHTYWICECECGNTKVIRGDTLNVVKSCGCLKKQQDKVNLIANHRHKKSGTRLYTEWISMKDRCNNPNNKRYSRYGGRGIRICDSWNARFENFQEWAINNGYADDLTIDRIDVDGNYEPDNCRWVTRQVQNNNTSRTVKITHDGKTMSMMEWSKELNIPYHKLSYRHKKGIEGEEILNIPRKDSE